MKWWFLSILLLSLTSFIKISIPTQWAITCVNRHYYLYNPVARQNKFYIGIDTIIPEQRGLAGPGDISKDIGPDWAIKTSYKVINKWGFDGGGAWCDKSIFPNLPHGIVLNILRTFPNINSENWQSDVDILIKNQVLPQDSNLIGYWLDNEIQLNDQDSLKYFKTCHDVIKKYDPQHLIFGLRFNHPPSDIILKNSKGYVNAQSFNIYSTDLHKWDNQFIRVYNLAGVPSFISEFSFWSNENSSQDKNTLGFGGEVFSQEKRKEFFIEIINIWRANPLIIGANWFQYCDEPPSGRFDGEDCNYGLVNINDTEYPIANVFKEKRIQRGDNGQQP